jgi:hypothetical protein
MSSSLFLHKHQRLRKQREKHGRSKGKKKFGVKIRRKLSLFPLVNYNTQLEVLDKIEDY